MKKRPDLKIGLNATEFKEYYYLKEELVVFCRDNGISTQGGKTEITKRVFDYLDSGIKSSNTQRKPKQTKAPMNLSLETIIEPNIKCSEIHRAFFKEQLGNSFSFNVAFQKWLKANTGKSYNDACKAYLEIQTNKKNSKTEIDKQFEYNTYIRDFFAENKGKTLKEAILCWKHKKGLPGHNKYESIDLKILNKATKW